MNIWLFPPSKKIIFINFFGCPGSSLQPVGSNSLTRDGTQVPFTGNVVNYPLNSQGSPYFHLLTTINNAAMDMGVQVSVWGPCFQLFEVIYLETELLNHMEILHLTCRRTSKQSSAVAEPFSIPTSIIWVFHLYTILPTLVIFRLVVLFSVCLVFFFFIIIILVGGKWYCIVVLICISLLTNNIEHLLMCLLAIYISFLELCQGWLSIR